MPESTYEYPGVQCKQDQNKTKTAKTRPQRDPMKSFIFMTLLASILSLGCTASPAPIQDEATPNIEATITAAIQTAIPNPANLETPNIDATVEAKVRATQEAAPTERPSTDSTQSPSSKTITPTLSSMVDLVRPSVVRVERGGGMGSGFIIATAPTAGANSDAALIVTNHHVIKDASVISVTVNDRDLYRAEVIVDDQYNDLALLKICCGDFEYLERASRSDTAEGNQAVAIGYPFGLEGKATVTDGIISAARFDNRFGQWVIQTDAAINPGNSGGPLVSSEGKLLGVNTRGRAQADGIGYAVSERTLAYVIDRYFNKSGNPIDHGDTVTYHDNTVYFLEPVTRQKAEQYMNSLIERGVTNPNSTQSWQLRLVDGEYEIRAGLYNNDEIRYLSTSEQREWLVNYHNDPQVRRSLRDAVCERQEEDFDDVPTTFLMVDLTTLRFDGVIQWIPCIK